VIVNLQQRYRAWLWGDQVLSPAWSMLQSYARLAAALADDVRNAEISLRAMSLVYTTILSLVPMLAFSFSLLKAFGVHDRMAPMLQLFLQPIGADANRLSSQILSFVNNLDVALLGFVGLVLLIYTMLRLMYKVQKSLDHTWDMSELPSLGKRIADYLTSPGYRVYANQLYLKIIWLVSLVAAIFIYHSWFDLCLLVHAELSSELDGSCHCRRGRGIPVEGDRFIVYQFHCQFEPV